MRLKVSLDNRHNLDVEVNSTTKEIFVGNCSMDFEYDEHGQMFITKVTIDNNKCDCPQCLAKRSPNHIVHSPGINIDNATIAPWHYPLCTGYKGQPFQVYYSVGGARILPPVNCPECLKMVEEQIRSKP